MQWFLKLMEELRIECRVGHPAKILAAEARGRWRLRGKETTPFAGFECCSPDAYSDVTHVTCVYRGKRLAKMQRVFAGRPPGYQTEVIHNRW